MFTLTNVFSYVFGRGRIFQSGIHGSFRQKHTSYRNPGILLEMCKSIIPPLAYDQHKGLMGRIGVVGGCKEYTGAPYYAAISSLKLGADLSHVFCTESSSVVIKSYSPELIVHPVLDHIDAVTEIDQWLQRLHALVVGPGLGREPQNLQNAKGVIEKAKEKDIPLVIDADGLFLVTEYPEVIANYKKAILTPNVVEFARLYEKMTGEKPQPEEPVINVSVLSRKLGNVTIVQKGENDIISDGENVLICCEEGSPRRCGGQGDLLSGTMGTFTYWAHKVIKDGTYNDTLQSFGPTICAAYAACLLTRQCNRQAFQKNHRSTTTQDMIQEIGAAFETLYM